MRLLFIDFTIQHLFDDADYPVGGWAVELRAWLAGFRGLGVKTAVISTTSASTAAESAGETQLLRVYAPRGRIPGYSYLFGFLPRAVAVARKFKPDALIQATASAHTGLMWMLSRILGVPFVYRCANDIDVDDRVHQRLGPMTARLFTLGLSRADGIVAQNGGQLDAVRKRFPATPALTLYNPYQIRQQGASRPRAERRYIAWLGVFQPQKNLPLLARIATALPQLEFRVGGKPELHMSDRATLEALEVLETLPNVALIGYVRRKQVADFLSDAILLLSTSHYEGFSNTFLEAWGAGTPMVTPRAVDPDALIATKRLGRVVDDPEQLVHAIDEIVDLSPEEYEALSDHCRAYVETEHDPVRLATGFRAFLEELGAKT